MPKDKRAKSETEVLAQQLADQLLGSDPTPERLQEVIGGLLGSAPFDVAFDDPFLPSPIELPDPPADPLTFTVRVDLRDAKPPIWRQLEIPGDMTLDRVSDALQFAMGWAGFHLHRFELHTGTGRPGAYLVNDEDEEAGPSTHEADVRLDQVLHEAGDKLRYEYDFGDGWEHVLQVKKVTPGRAERVRCVGGRRACPPEDCGGMYGYEEILEILKTPEDQLDEWGRERLEWMPDGFDPAAFDVAETDQALQQWSSGDLQLGGPMPPMSLLPLLKQSPFPPDDLMDLIGAAHLDDQTPEPSTEVAARLVQPWLVLMREIGDGLKLTGAGYLPPAAVKRIFDELHLERDWIGKGNREDMTPPVADLRASAQALGLIRKRKGVLLPTATGKKLCGGADDLIGTAADPLALLRHIEGRLPLEKSGFGRQAALLVMLVVAVGARPSEGTEPAADLLTGLGWRADGHASVPPVAVHEQAELTYAVLEHLHWAAGGADHGTPPSTPDPVRDLARRALAGDEITPDMLQHLPTPGGPLVTIPQPSPLPESDGPAGLTDLPDPEQIVAEATTALLEGIAEARHPLAAELTLCPAFATFRLAAPDDLDEQQLTMAMAAMLTDIYSYAASVGDQDALGLLRVASVLGPAATRDGARASADRLAADGVPERPWAKRVGKPDLLRAWRYGDHGGEQESIGLLFDHRGREHAVMVLIDHLLGGGVKDCWVAEGRQAAKLHDDVRREIGSRPEAFFEDIDAVGAADLLEAALAQPPCAEQEDQVEDVALHLELLRSRVERLRQIAPAAR